MKKNVGNAMERLFDIVKELREKCPWDRKQTIHTLRTLSIEELYELTDAISEENWEGMREELGDVLLHIVFYAVLAAEQQKFTLQEVIDGICEKLIVRHPHVYGTVAVRNEDDVKKNWEAIKLKEGKSSALSGVPASLPAMVKAIRIQEKAKQTGFEWKHTHEVWAKVQEELHELQEAIAENQQANMEEELGDVLFSIINYARFLNIDAESALEKTNKKFIQRFQKMEAMAAKQQKNLHEFSLEEMDSLWTTIKQNNLKH
jgi:XTP/dITP diphosphohydrolase